MSSRWWECITLCRNVGRGRSWKLFAVVLLQFTEWNRDNETIDDPLGNGDYQTGSGIGGGTDGEAGIQCCYLGRIQDLGGERKCNNFYTNTRDMY